MKKRILILAMVLVLAVSFTACGNKAIIDTTYKFNRAIIKLQDGTVVDTKIKTWNDYDGEQLQITTKDGTVYLVNSVNCTLIKD